MKFKEIYLIGAPRRVGGAGTELMHLIDLFLEHQIEVHLVNSGWTDEPVTKYYKSKGVISHPMPSVPRHWHLVKDKLVVSLGYVPFLLQLDYLIDANPCIVLWGSCMYDPTQTEIMKLREGRLFNLLFVSKAQRDNHIRQFKDKGVNRYTMFDEYIPYFNLDNPIQNLCFKTSHHDLPEFTIGRVSRDDPRKFPKNQWDVYNNIRVPDGVEKRAILLGCGANSLEKIGPAPHYARTIEPYEMDIRDFHQQTDVIVQHQDSITFTGESINEGESFGRWIIEAYAAGTPIVTQNDWSYPELIENKMTGILCDSVDDMVIEASELAHNTQKRQQLADNGYERLRSIWANQQRCWQFWSRWL